MKKHEITMKELQVMNCSTFSRKDNSPRGFETVSINDLHLGDEIIINNYFTEIVIDNAPRTWVNYELETPRAELLKKKLHEMNVYYEVSDCNNMTHFQVLVSVEELDILKEEFK